MTASDDRAALVQEVELLALQARAVRAENKAAATRLRSAAKLSQERIDSLNERILRQTERIRDQRDRIKALEERLQELHDSPRFVSEEELAEMNEARNELRSLVDRLGSSPLGPVLRQREGWRALERRWG